MPHRDSYTRSVVLCSSTEGETVTLGASTPALIAACSSANCAQPMQQDGSCTQVRAAAPVSDLHFQKMPSRVAPDSSFRTDHQLAAEGRSVHGRERPYSEQALAADCTAQTHPSSVLNTQLGKGSQTRSALAMEVTLGQFN